MQRCIDVETTLYKRHVPAGLWIMTEYDLKLVRVYIGIYIRVSFGGKKLGCRLC